MNRCVLSVLLLRSVFVIFSLLMFFTTLSAQTNDDKLSYIDSLTKSLCALTDENRFNYEYPQWQEVVNDVLATVDDSAVAHFNPQHLKHISVPYTSSDIYYFFRQTSSGAVIHWSVRRSAKGKLLTHSFADAVPSQSVAHLHVRPSDYRSLLGFEVFDTLEQKTLYWMPDIETRLNFEVLADIKAPKQAKLLAKHDIESRMDELWHSDEALTIDLSGLPRLKTVNSPDKRLRLATYMTMYKDFSSQYFGNIIRRKADGTIDVYPLYDLADEYKNPERTKGSPEKWYGAVYFDIAEVFFEKQKYYTLIGFRQQDALVKCRVLDLLWFKGRKVTFGASLFLHEKSTYQRRVFRYSSEANMMVMYDDKEEMIIFDHLSPTNSLFRGEYRFYGPDFSYDAYEVTRDGWKYKEDIDFRPSR